MLALTTLYYWDFNPRIPWRMRPSSYAPHPISFSISIHASREGCDLDVKEIIQYGKYFNPRIPWRMRPIADDLLDDIYYFNPRIPWRMRRAAYFPFHPWHLISIHASREGCDYWFRRRCGMASDFNPRIPWRMRPVVTFTGVNAAIFQSTHPVKDATNRHHLNLIDIAISIHASREGCDGRTVSI